MQSEPPEKILKKKLLPRKIVQLTTPPTKNLYIVYKMVHPKVILCDAQKYPQIEEKNQNSGQVKMKSTKKSKNKLKKGNNG